MLKCDILIIRKRGRARVEISTGWSSSASQPASTTDSEFKEDEVTKTKKEKYGML